MTLSAAEQAALYAVKAARDSGVAVHGTLTIQSVVGVGDGGIGAFSTLLRGHVGGAAIICDPTSLNLIPADCLTFFSVKRITWE